VVFAYCHFIALGFGMCEWLALIFILLGLRAPDALPEHCENKDFAVHGSPRLSAAVGDKANAPMHGGCQSSRPPAPDSTLVGQPGRVTFRHAGQIATSSGMHPIH
jgi:hypothetical protein